MLRLMFPPRFRRTRMMALTAIGFLLALMLLPSAASPTTAGSVSTRIRLGVVADGIYRLTPDDLTLAGVDVSAIDPRTFALTSLGQSVAVRVVGEIDGSFDPGDSLEFFGERYRSNDQDEKYTDERVYWLTIGGTLGPRILDADATPSGDLTPVADFPDTVRAEESKLWYTQHTLNPPTKDTWFWDELRPSSTTAIVRSYPWITPYPVTSAGATISIDLNARSASAHLVEIIVNGVKITDAAWTGKTRHYQTIAIPSGPLIDDTSILTLNALTAPNVRADWIYLNYWKLSYRRLFRAWEGQVDFTTELLGPHLYHVDNWDSHQQVRIWNITDPLQPKHLVGASSVNGEVGQALAFQVDDIPGDRFWMQTAATISTPANIRLTSTTHLRTPVSGADTVIVTSTELRPAAEQLAAWHETQGRRVLVADFQDVVDEFNDGIYHPRAVPTMLAWAHDHWPQPAPQFLTLVGDGHWNFKGFNPDLYPPTPQHIPPYLAWVDPTQGEVPADAWYGDIDGDRLPDVAVGRLAVNTLPEAETVVAKTVNYKGNRRLEPWQQRAIFVADNPDGAGDFPAVTDDIINNYLAADITPERIYLGDTHPDAESANAAIIDAVNSGAWMVQYAGHGATSRWSHEQIWTLDDIPSLQNASDLPIVMTFNCLDGYFVYPQEENYAIAEVMNRYPNGGSVAAISPTGLGFTNDQHRYRQILMEEIFDQQQPTLGQALLATNHRYYDERGPHYMVDTMTIFGDPALPMPAAAERIFLPAMAR